MNAYPYITQLFHEYGHLEKVQAMKTQMFKIASTYTESERKIFMDNMEENLKKKFEAGEVPV